MSAQGRTNTRTAQAFNINCILNAYRFCQASVYVLSCNCVQLAVEQVTFMLSWLGKVKDSLNRLGKRFLLIKD